MRHLVLVALLLALGCPLQGASASPEDSAAPDRGRTLRASLTAPNPATTFRYSGEVSAGRAKAGEVSLLARAKRSGRSSVWSVEERIDQNWGGERLSLRAGFDLRPDLSLRSGSYALEIRGSKFVLTLLRTPDGVLQVTRAVTPWNGQTKKNTFDLEAPADVMAGTSAIGILARAMQKGPAHALEVTKLDLYGMAVLGVKGKAATQTLKLTRSAGEASLSRPVGDPLKTHAVEARWQGEVPAYRTDLNFHFAASGGAFVAREAAEEGGARHWWPKGSLEAAPALPEEAKAESWEQALLKFGFGYHMARRELLEDAFWWDTFRESEIKGGAWDAKEDVEAFRAAWISAFFEGSQNRSRAETSGLLNGTLKTGTARKVDATHIVFKADPQFGGGVQRTYYFARRDGIWRLIRIEF